MRGRDPSILAHDDIAKGWIWMSRWSLPSSGSGRIAMDCSEERADGCACGESPPSRQERGKGGATSWGGLIRAGWGNLVGRPDSGRWGNLVVIPVRVNSCPFP